VGRAWCTDCARKVQERNWLSRISAFHCVNIPPLPLPQ
jgi:hypothetical protein